MQTVTVVAVRDFFHKGRQYRTGDNVTMTALEAAIEAQNHTISLAERPTSYQTRQMLAEPVAPVAPVAAPVRRRSRRTRRKDLAAHP